ncbi:serine hydrolase domain-containing protein [Hyphococcus sp. DH-69]|uniref:serine hydrolase domain-containing protein n=1 Tax=Hyphococcus formosus TaxID=3143534 RepID=UPI00398B95DE
MKIVKTISIVLGTIIALGAWVAFTIFGAFLGWWMKPIATPDDHDAFIEKATTAIASNNLGNTAFVLIENGEVVGEYYAQSGRNIDSHTAFPTASFSKWITALGVNALADQGRIDLDAPVSTYLSRWHLPETGYNNDGVTIRRLLSHTAGLTDGLGFADFGTDEDIPALEDSLSNPRASSGEDVVIAAGAEPGESFAYSGGGYLILQLLIEEVSGQSFEDFIDETILSPLDMRESSFAFIGDIPNATASFTVTGVEAPQYKYAALGATGFSSSTSDLTKLVKAMIASTPSFGVTTETLTSMRAPIAYVFGSPIWGSGPMLFAPTGAGDYIYGHDGVNEPAINVSVRINPITNDAYIMLVNGHPSLASDIGGEWVLWQSGIPDFLSTERALESALKPAAIGSVIILLVIAFFIRRSR